MTKNTCTYNEDICINLPYIFFLQHPVYFNAVWQLFPSIINHFYDAFIVYKKKSIIPNE